MTPLIPFFVVLILLFVGLYLIAQTEKQKSQTRTKARLPATAAKIGGDNVVHGEESKLGSQALAIWVRQSKAPKLSKDGAFAFHIDTPEHTFEAPLRIIQAFGGISDKKAAQPSTLGAEIASHYFRSGPWLQNRRRKLPRAPK
jgi:hypothetical protein